MSMQGAMPVALDPMPHGLRHYVVVLQNRKGEREALRHADEEVLSRTTPVFAFRPQGEEKDLLRSTTLNNWIRVLSRLIDGRPCFLDVQSLEKRWVEARGKPAPAAEVLFAAARTHQLLHVPVLPTKCNKQLRRAVLDAAFAVGTGVALRHRFMKVLASPRKQAAGLKKLVHAAGVDFHMADLLIDAEFLDPDDEVDGAGVAAVVEAVAGIGSWRSFALLGTSIPAAMSAVQEGTVGSLPRKEWRLWRDIQSLNPTRMPVYGDYAVQHPRRPSSTGPGMRANIRYTTAEDVLVARGTGPIFENGAAQYRDLCIWLRDLPEYCGASYSWGDAAIDQVASGEIAPAGGQDHWRAVGTSHHMRFVVDQLA